MWKWIWCASGAVVVGVAWLLALPVSGPGALALAGLGTEMFHHGLAMP
jgi:hypothetical protein